MCIRDRFSTGRPFPYEVPVPPLQIIFNRSKPPHTLPTNHITHHHKPQSQKIFTTYLIPPLKLIICKGFSRKVSFLVISISRLKNQNRAEWRTRWFCISVWSDHVGSVCLFTLCFLQTRKDRGKNVARRYERYVVVFIVVVVVVVVVAVSYTHLTLPTICSV